jgi:ABC-type multidrug transport system ATPase subunit
MTIHQPSSDIFAKFDKLFLMVEGKLVYQGEASKALNYFSSNFSLACP